MTTLPLPIEDAFKLLSRANKLREAMKAQVWDEFEHYGLISLGYGAEYGETPGVLVGCKDQASIDRLKSKFGVAFGDVPIYYRVKDAPSS